MFRLFKKQITTEKAIRKYLGINPKTNKLHVFKYGDGYAIGYGKGNRRCMSDWLCYDCSFKKVLIFNSKHVLIEALHDVIKDVDLFSEREKRLNIQTIPSEALLNILR